MIQAVDRLDVAVVGAGPYGLSMAAHLAPRARVRTFGAPMHTWRALMPPEMLMRSHWDETRLSSPGDDGGLEDWSVATGEPRVEPTPLRMFLRYADWFRERFVPESDPADVARVERDGGGFRIVTAAGDEARADRLVAAVGVMPFPRSLPVLERLDDERVVHAVDPRGFERVEGRRVIVLGGGQNGLESAALAADLGAASVELVVRSQVRWFTSREPWQTRSAFKERLYKVAYPIYGFGPPPINRLVLHPDLFAALPKAVRDRLRARLLRSGGSPWVRGQVEGRVTVTEGRSLVRASATPAGIELVFDDGSRREADLVVVCLGYRFDLERLGWLAPEVRAGIRTEDGWPVLDRAFRTSDERLQMIGFAAESHFGPLTRFVAGCTFTALRAVSVH